MLHKFSVLILVSFITSISYAGSEDLNYNIHRTYTTARSMSMGGVMSSIADDYSALFFNPAGLATLKEAEVNLTIQGGVSKKFFEISDDISDANKVGTDGSQERTDALIAAIEKHYGDVANTRVSLSAIWARPGWAIGFIPVDVDLNLGVHRSLGPQINAEAYQDSTIAFGYARQVEKVKGLSWGATVKAMYRGYMGKALLAADLMDDKFIDQKDFKEGFTTDVDLGALYTSQEPKYSWAKPTYSLVVRNVLDLGFKQNLKLYNKDASGEPPKLERRADAGVSWELPGFWVFTPRLALEEQDIGHPYWNYLKGLHFGAELGWNANSWLSGAYRAGINQGYISAGLTLQLALFRLDLSTWGEEVGTSSTKHEDRRYMANMGLDW